MDMQVDESGGEQLTVQIDGLLVPVRRQRLRRNLCDRAIDDAHVAILLDVIGKNEPAAAQNHMRCQGGLCS